MIRIRLHKLFHSLILKKKSNQDLSKVLSNAYSSISCALVNSHAWKHELRSNLWSASWTAVGRSNEAATYRAPAINFLHLLSPPPKKDGQKEKRVRAWIWMEGWKGEREWIGESIRLTCVQGGAWRHWWLMAVINQPIEFHSVDISLPSSPSSLPPSLAMPINNPWGSQVDEDHWFDTREGREREKRGRRRKRSNRLRNRFRGKDNCTLEWEFFAKRRDSWLVKLLPFFFLFYDAERVSCV